MLSPDIAMPAGALNRSVVCRWEPSAAVAEVLSRTAGKILFSKAYLLDSSYTLEQANRMSKKPMATQNSFHVIFECFSHLGIDRDVFNIGTSC